VGHLESRCRNFGDALSTARDDCDDANNAFHAVADPLLVTTSTVDDNVPQQLNPDFDWCVDHSGHFGGSACTVTVAC
jgi:hypothetical protein